MSVRLTPKDFFLNVAVMVTLYVSVISFITLVFQYIDALFPTELTRFQDPYSSGISFAIASLIIIFPLFLFFTRILNKDIRANPEKRDLGIRRWLVYITLFVAGVGVVVDLIVLLHTFLSGQELTVGFLLKVLTIIIVVGGVFVYYFLDLKRKWEREEGLSKTIGAVVGVVVLVSVAGGFFVLGSPQSNRLARVDAEKVNDLQSIQIQIVNFWQQKNRLPNSLEELEDPLVGFVLPLDPQTNESYIYKETGRLSFELCAMFNRESREGVGVIPRAVSPLEKSFVFEGANWEHGEGEMCFARTVDPERLPRDERF